MSAAAPSIFGQNPQTDPNQLPGQANAGANPDYGSAFALGSEPDQGVLAQTNFGLPTIPTVDTSPMFTQAGGGLTPAIPFPGRATGPMTDSQYIADEANLRYQISQQYGDLLQQLGYTDPTTGQALQGTIAAQGNIRAQQLQHDLQQEAIATQQQMQQQGTLFSGIYGQQLAQAQYPTVQGLGQLQLDTATSQANALKQAQELINQYNAQNNSLLAQAAGRYAVNQQNQAIITAAQQAAQAAAAAAAAGAGGQQQTTPPADTLYPAGPNTVGIAGVTNPSSSQPGVITTGGQNISGAAGTQTPTATPPPARTGSSVAMGEGAIATEPTQAVVGEKGPEVVIPLSKLAPRSQIRLLQLADEAGIFQEALKRMGGS